MSITPDYTTQITTTTNGVTYVIPSVVHQGGNGNTLSTARIAGITVGLTAISVLVIGLVFWIFWRRRSNKRETKWEMPSGGSTKYPKDMPIDRRLAGVYRTGTTATARSAGGQSQQGSLRSVGSAAHLTGGRPTSHDSEPGTPLDSPLAPSYYMPFSDDSPVSLDGFNGRIPVRSASGSSHPQSRYGKQSSEDPFAGGSSMEHLSPSMRPFHVRGGSMTGSRLANAFLGSPADYHTQSSSGFEEVQLHDRSNQRGPSMTASGHEAAAMRRGATMQSGQTYESGQGNGSHAGTMRSGNVVVHSDAGLLLDDSLSDDEDGMAEGGDDRVVELPPQYTSLPARQERGERAPTLASSMRSRSLRFANGGSSAADAHHHGGTYHSGQMQRSATDEYIVDGDAGATRASTAAATRQGRGDDDAASQTDRRTLDGFVGDEDDETFWRR